MKLGRSPIRPVLAVIGFVASSTAGLLLAYQLYLVNEDKDAGSGYFRFSWSEATAYSPLVAVCMGVASSILLLLWAIQTRKKLKGVSVSFLLMLTFTWGGFSAGLLGPVILGYPASWQEPGRITTGIYNLRVTEVQIDSEIQDFGEGSRPGPYVSEGDNGITYLAQNSPATKIFGRDTVPILGEVMLGSSEDVEGSGFWPLVNLTKIDPEIQHLRDLQYNSGYLYFTNVPFSDGCLSMQVWRLRTDTLPNIDEQSLTKLWQSTPCLTWQDGTNGEIGRHTSGGRLAFDQDGDYYLTLGDFRIGPSVEVPYTERPMLLGDTSPYGKVLLISESGETEIISSGHRNQQGLVLTSHGSLFLTEHGPRGGGELNLIVQGDDYGWPDVTFGAPYGKENLPASEWDFERWNNHQGPFRAPVIAWIPSIAPSQVIEYRGREEFPGWHEDLLVTSLVGEGVRRLRLDGDRVVYDEPIDFGVRLRDIVQLESGQLLLTSDNGEVYRVYLDR